MGDVSRPGQKAHFPTLQPNIVIWSKKIILVELAVPWEEGREEAHERKSLTDCHKVQGERLAGVAISNRGGVYRVPSTVCMVGAHYTW